MQETWAMGTDLGRPKPGWRARQMALGVLFFLGLAVVPAHGTKYAAEFLRIGAGARALGMGGAVTGQIDDATAVYWNPAAMVGVQRAELALMHSEQFSNLADYDFAGYVQKLSSTGSVGFGLVRFGVSDIRITKDAYEDTNGNHQFDWGEPIDAGKFYLDSDTEYGFYFAFARALDPRLALGGTLKLVRQDLPGHGSFGVGTDLGLLWTPLVSMRFGARLSDATTTQLYWDTGRRETVTPSLFLGAAWRHGLPAQHIDLALAADLALTFDGRQTASTFSIGSAIGGDPRIGFEAGYRRVFAARVGWQESGVTAGAGFRVRGFGVDYAFVPHEELGSSHRVSASYSF
jgi:hypothetical protein